MEMQNTGLTASDVMALTKDNDGFYYDQSGLHIAQYDAPQNRVHSPAV